MQDDGEELDIPNDADSRILKKIDQSGTKGTIGMRSMFHFTPKRIEEHFCICLVVYKVYKELERILHSSGINMSVDKVLDIAQTIMIIKINLPVSGNTLIKTIFLTQKHRSIAKLFDEYFWKFFPRVTHCRSQERKRTNSFAQDEFKKNELERRIWSGITGTVTDQPLWKSM